ncbi:hypothetical protein BJX99DRAFT_8651 [Aspergillus californicus]
MRGTYEYSDFPMDDSFGVAHGEHIPGHVVQRYLERYAEHFDLASSIRLNAAVSAVAQNPDSTWTVTYTSQENTIQLHAAKLILATGITSQPYLPSIPGQEAFARPLFHSSEIPTHHSTLRTPNNRIAVLGATKSAWDAVYTAATAGAAVDWIIRANGHGPCWMAPPYVTPLHRWLEKLVTTRLLTWFSPCIWAGADPVADGGVSIRSFLHGTWLGRKITDGFWGILRNDVVGLNKFNSHPELKKLEPWFSPFWVATGLSILNYPTDFFDLVTGGKVRVHVDSIVSLTERTIHLSSAGPLTDIDALVVASGWSPTPAITFTPPSLLTDLGFPTAPDPLPNALTTAATAEILKRFPRLATQPTHVSPKPYEPLAADAQTESQSLHPYRLTRFMVPASPLAEGRSIAFMGVAMTINTPLLAQTQALWVAAFLGGRLDLGGVTRERCPVGLRGVVEEYIRGQTTPSESGLLKMGTTTTSSSSSMDSDKATEADTLWETALHTQFGVHRYPGGLGRRNPDFVFDAIPYVDLLLKDLGVRGDRKRGRGWRQWVEPCGMEDYVGVVEEWMGQEELRHEAKKTV